MQGRVSVHRQEDLCGLCGILINEGVDIITVAKRLGHKDPNTTGSIYAHVLAKADAEANKALADVLFKKKA